MNAAIDPKRMQGKHKAACADGIRRSLGGRSIRVEMVDSVNLDQSLAQSHSLASVDQMAHGEMGEGESASEGEVRICGNCRWVKRPRRWTLNRLRMAAEDGLTQLLREVEALRRQKYWCSREGCWTHLLDGACSLWQAAEDGREA